MDKRGFHYTYPRLTVISMYFMLCSMLTSSWAVKKVNSTQTNNELVVDMCRAQCIALCAERNIQGSWSPCGLPCNNLDQQMLQGDLVWEIYFPERKSPPDVVELVGSCSAIKHDTDSVSLPERPRPMLWRVTTREITFTWDQDPAASGHEIVYVVIKRIGDGPWKLLDPLGGDTEFTDTISDFCSNPKYRVAAVSRYGSKWFSEDVQPPELIPGEPRDIKIRSLYYRRVDSTSDIFNFELEWKPPKGWFADDLQVSHRIEKSTTCYSHMAMPFIVIDRIQLSHYNDRISAVSRCDRTFAGPPAKFSFLLTCDLVPGYKGEYCEVPTVHPPGNVQDVQMTVVPFSEGVIALVSWQPPTDLGSSGIVEAYHLFYGLVQFKEIFQTYVNTPRHMVKSGGDVSADLYFNVTTLDAYQTIGVTVMAAGPKQTVDAPVGTIHVPKDHLDSSPVKGDILANSENIIVVGQDQDLPASNTHTVGVKIFWKRPKPDARVNLTQFGLSWGLLKAEASNGTGHPGLALEDDTVEQTTVDARSYTVSLRGLIQNCIYGIKILNLHDNQSLPSFAESVWSETPTAVFVTPFLNGIPSYPNPMRKSDISFILFHENFAQSLSAFAPKLRPKESDFDNVTMPPGIPTKVVPTEDNTSIALIAFLAAAVIVTVVAIGVCSVLRRRRALDKERLLVSEPPEYRPYTLFRPGFGFSSDDQGENHCPVVADEWELPLSCLKFGRVLGSGAFGNVIKGRVTRAMLTHRGVMHLLKDDGSGEEEQDKLHVTVAIKMLPENCDEKHRRDFTKEIQQMKRIGHHNYVVSILGCCTLRHPLCLVVEHMANGDLLNYLKNLRLSLTSSSGDSQQMYVNQEHEPNSTDLLKFAWQITKGMDFLVSKGFVHRDLAARNVLLDSRMVCKIGDFGLTRYMYDDAVYVNRHGGRLPIKWMSVEAIFDMSFSTASDVWSFGIVLFELVTLGGTPYPTIPSRMLLKKLKRGYRMERPDNCSEEIYEMMMACWREDPTARPSFDALSQWLDSIITEQSGLEYLDLHVNPDIDIYLADEDSEEEDIRTLPVCLNEDTDLTTAKHQAFPMTGGGRDLSLKVTASSTDSGYISAQKCSVSSGDSSTITAPTGTMSANPESEIKSEIMNSEISEKHTSGHSVEEIESEGLAEDICDDVFHEGVTMDTNFLMFSPAALLKRDTFGADRGYQNIEGLRGDGREGNENEETQSDSLFDVSQLVKRALSDSLLNRLNNFESSDKEVLSSHNPLRKNLSTPLEFQRYGKKNFSRSSARDSSLRLRLASKRRKAEIRKKGRPRTRRNAVVDPPTLAMDNDFYFALNREKQQLPPPTRIPRKTRRDIHLEQSERGGGESKLEAQLKETISMNFPPASDRNSLNSKRRRKSSIFQYIVFADVHNACEDSNESIDDRQLNSDAIQPDQSISRPKETPPSPLVKKTFVKPADSKNSRPNCNILNDERDRASIGDLLPSQHQYTDFNDILKHAFSPTRWQYPNSRAFIYSSDLCLTEQSDNKHKIGNASELMSSHQRSFSEDSALDFYGLDRGGSKDSPSYLSFLKGFSDWVGQTSKKGGTFFGFQDNQENQPPKGLTYQWPVCNQTRRLSDPFSRQKETMCDFSAVLPTRQSSRVFPCCLKSQACQFLSFRKRKHGNTADSQKSRPQNLATEKHPSALYGVKTDVLEDSPQTSLIV